MNFIDIQKQVSIYREEIDKAISKVLDSGQFILGSEVREIENILKEYVGVKEAIGVGSGTEALLVALMSLGVKAGDEVITTPFTFIATAESIALLGAKPVFVDITPEYFDIDIQQIEDKVSQLTRAILPVSLYGQMCDIESIMKIGETTGLPVIEDGAQSFGASNERGMSCSLADIGCTSFFPAKSFGCYGDGGMVFTNDSGLAESMRQIRVHGQERRYLHATMGINGRLDTLQAAIMMAKFPHFPAELDKRVENANYYTKHLNSIERIACPKVRPGFRHIYSQYSVRVDDRESLVNYLKDKGIPTAIHYPIPLHLQPVFKELGHQKGDFPVSEKAAEEILSLPFHPFLERSDQDRIIEAIQEWSKS